MKLIRGSSNEHINLHVVQTLYRGLDRSYDRAQYRSHNRAAARRLEQYQ